MCDARESSPIQAAVLLGMLRELYDVEARWRELNPADHKARHLDSDPLRALLLCRRTYFSNLSIASRSTVYRIS